jgi:hypothetical protein
VSAREARAHEKAVRKRAWRATEPVWSMPTPADLDNPQQPARRPKGLPRAKRLAKAPESSPRVTATFTESYRSARVSGQSVAMSVRVAVRAVASLWGCDTMTRAERAGLALMAECEDDEPVAQRRLSSCALVFE